MFLLKCIKDWWWALYPVVMCLFAYTDINAEAFTILAIFLVFDTITWVIKVIAVGKKPTSRRFIVGVVSKLLMLTVPLVISLLAKVVTGNDVSWFIWASVWLLALAEAYSIIQNVVSIKLQKEIEEYDAITVVLTYILSQIRKILENWSR